MLSIAMAATSLILTFDYAVLKTWSDNQFQSRSEITNVAIKMTLEKEAGKTTSKMDLWWAGNSSVRGDIYDFLGTDRYVCCIGYNGTNNALAGKVTPLNSCISINSADRFTARQLFTLGDPRFIGFTCECRPWSKPLGNVNECFDQIKAGSVRLSYISLNDTTLIQATWSAYQSTKVVALFDKNFRSLISLKFINQRSSLAYDYKYAGRFEKAELFPSEVAITTYRADNSIQSKSVLKVSNVELSKAVVENALTLEGMNFPEGKLFCVDTPQRKNEIHKLNGNELFSVETKIPVDSSQDSTTYTKSTPTPQPVAGENPNRLYYLIAAGVLLLGAIGIAFVLLRRKANTT